MEQLVEVAELTVEVRNNGRYYKALENVSFQIEAGDMVGIVGESGCGKSLTSLSIMGLLPETARASSGSIRFRGKELLSLPEEERCKMRGKDISMIFQEPMTALNPVMTCGQQISEAYRSHHVCTREEAYNAAIGMMKQVGLSRPESLYREYPHRLSGGMKQRIVIAIALINHPALLIADEPTTALDVTIQLQILELIRELNRSLSSTVLLITHDLGIVREVCTKMIVMYAGYVVEKGSVADILGRPLHPYTKQLLDSIPTAKKRGQELYSIPGVVAPLTQRKATGCPFAERCREVRAECSKTTPQLTAISKTEPQLATVQERKVRCFLAGGELNGQC